MNSLLKRIKQECEYIKSSLSSIIHYYSPKLHKESMLKHLNKEINSSSSKIFTPEMKFPVILDKPFSKYLIKFLNSPRNKDNPTININNLLFLTGPEKSGKTWFLRQVLNQWSNAETKYKNFAIHFDCASAQNFSSFLYLFEKEIIDSLDIKSQEIKEIFTIELLMNLLFFRYERGWIEYHLYQELRNIKENESIIDLDLTYVDDLLLLYYNKSYKETPLIDNFQSIASNLSQKSQISMIKSTLIIIQQILIKREDFESSKNHLTEELHGLKYNKYHFEQYRTGINVLEYFLDIINYLSGYHEKHLLEVKFGFKLQENNKQQILLQSALILESAHKLLEYVDCEKRGENYIQHIILRLYVSNY